MSQAPIILSSGALARYPLARKEKFSTRKIEFADFSRQTFAQLANPLSQWVLNLDLLQDQEVSDWRQFFRDCQGGANSFAFIDPWDNLLQYSEALENAVWAMTNCSAAPDASAADIFGLQSSRARLVTFTASGTSAGISQTIPIIPAGYGNSR